MTSRLVWWLLVIPHCLARPQAECDDIFGDCQKIEECEEIFGCDSAECFDSSNEIDDSVFAGDTRQAFNDCNKEKKCESYAASGYACAPTWTCHNNTIITDGKGLIDVRQADDVCAKKGGTIDISDTKCDQTDYVCCKRPNYRIEPCTTIDTEINEKLKFEKCGRTGTVFTVTGVQKEKDKSSAQPGEFPHMCVVYQMEGGQRVFIAGASLIARNKVITVAHKIHVVKTGESVDLREDANQFVVRCGEHNVKTEEELLDSQESEVAAIIFHPQYNPKNVHNNLVILRTKENFVYQQHIGPVCLPSPDQNFDKEENCFSSGWGKDDFNSFGTYSDSLKKVQMAVVPTSECEARLKEHERLKNKNNFKIHQSWICVGGENGSDTCTGDGGSPHVCKNNDDQWVQVGAVAWGLGCGDAFPAVYSSIPSAMCWIDWVMSCVGLAERNIDRTSADDFDLRGTEVESVNKISSGDCREWMEDNGDLGSRCEVQYEDIDERSGRKK
eukprot:GFUD01086953.1.p1 GENE.GFUD01086953.1~~GFUD01086953.1.p1  ORF type:complete len:499 (+),score=148.06 GFUD01086953.1:82-1578(+)